VTSWSISTIFIFPDQCRDKASPGTKPPGETCRKNKRKCDRKVFFVLLLLQQFCYILTPNHCPQLSQCFIFNFLNTFFFSDMILSILKIGTHYKQCRDSFLRWSGKDYIYCFSFIKHHIYLEGIWGKTCVSYFLFFMSRLKSTRSLKFFMRF
jgi:hypothetical protein